jgi:hypothetical protein
VAESEEAKRLAKAIAEQERIDKARAAQLKRETEERRQAVIEAKRLEAQRRKAHEELEVEYPHKNDK